MLARRRHRADPQVARYARTKVLGLAQRAVDDRMNVRRARDQGSTDLREHYAARCALKQPRTHGGLQPGDAFAQGRLGEPKLVRRAPEVAVLGDDTKVFEVSNFH